MKRTLVTVFLFLLCSSAYAWGEKGHYLCNEAATFGLPADMPQFFHRAYPELIFLAYDPDRWRGAGPSLDAANPPDHFLDAEFVAALTLPPDRYKYIALLYSSGTLRRHGIANSETRKIRERIRIGADDRPIPLDSSCRDDQVVWTTRLAGSPRVGEKNGHCAFATPTS